MPVIGIVFCLSWASFNWDAQIKLKETFSNMNETDMKLQEWGKLREKKLHEPPTKDNVFMSKTYAQLYYREYGKSLDILTAQGNIIKYPPTKEDIELYRQGQIVFENLRKVQRSQRESVVIWLANIPLSILAGLLLPSLRRRL